MKKEVIKEVKISPGCISCGTCEVICPKVFHLNAISRIREGVEYQQYQDCIKEAAEMCPVQAITIEME